MGLAYTWQSVPKTECTVFKGLRPLAGNPAGTVIELLRSEDTLAVTIALATANAVLNNSPKDALVGDLTKTLDLRATDTVVMVGAFLPVIEQLKDRVASLSVFERNPALGKDFLPAEKAFDQLPRSTVAIVTATSILNDTINRILEAAGNCREVVMLGASTPLCPEVFVGTSVTALSGVQVEDAAAVAQVISEGGGMKTFKNHVRKITLRV